MDIIKAIEEEQIIEGADNISVGNTIKVYYKIIEGKNERIQVFEGLCIAIKGSGLRKTFTLRKISYGVGVERTFPMHSPRIQKFETLRFGKIRRAKLYYIRDRVGKAAKVAELIRKKVKKTSTEKETAKVAVKETTKESAAPVKETAKKTAAPVKESAAPEEGATLFEQDAPKAKKDAPKTKKAKVETPEAEANDDNVTIMKE